MGRLARQRGKWLGAGWQGSARSDRGKAHVQVQRELWHLCSLREGRRRHKEDDLPNMLVNLCPK
jgi:hypothetical protein